MTDQNIENPTNTDGSHDGHIFEQNEVAKPATLGRPKRSSASISYISRRVFSFMPSAGLYPHEIESAIHRLLSEIKTAISSGRKVEIRGFGSFRSRKYKGKVTSINFRSFMRNV